MLDYRTVAAAHPQRADQPPPRSPALLLAALLALLLVGAGLGWWGPKPSWLRLPPPSRAGIEEGLQGQVVAYEVTDSGAFVALDYGQRMAFDELEVDLGSINNWFRTLSDWPLVLHWQLDGLGYASPQTADPASVALAACPGVAGERCGAPPWIYGKVDDPAIVALEVDRSGTTTRYPVTAPGFAIQLGPLDAGPAPSGYRWLDAAGRVVWQTTVPVDGLWPRDPAADRETQRADRRAQKERQEALGARATGAPGWPSVPLEEQS